MNDLNFRDTFGNFDIFFEDMVSGAAGYPVYNIYTKGEKSYIELACTGFSKKDLDVYIEDGLLIIEGTLSEKQNAEEKKKKYFYKKFPIKNFKRKFKIAPDLEVKDIEYKNGFLLVELIKKEKDVTLLTIN